MGVLIILYDVLVATPHVRVFAFQSQYGFALHTALPEVLYAGHLLTCPSSSDNMRSVDMIASREACFGLHELTRKSHVSAGHVTLLLIWHLFTTVETSSCNEAQVDCCAVDIFMSHELSLVSHWHKESASQDTKSDLAAHLRNLVKYVHVALSRPVAARPRRSATATSLVRSPVKENGAPPATVSTAAVLVEPPASVAQWCADYVQDLHETSLWVEGFQQG